MDRARQIGAFQVSAPQIRAPQVRAAELRAAQIRPAKDRVAKIRVAKVRLTKIGSGESGAYARDTGEGGLDQERTGEVMTMQTPGLNLQQNDVTAPAVLDDDHVISSLTAEERQHPRQRANQAAPRVHRLGTGPLPFAVGLLRSSSGVLDFVLKTEPQIFDSHLSAFAAPSALPAVCRTRRMAHAEIMGNTGAEQESDFPLPRHSVAPTL